MANLYAGVAARAKSKHDPERAKWSLSTKNAAIRSLFGRAGFGSRRRTAWYKREMIAYKHTPSIFSDDVMRGKIKISLLSHFRDLEREGSLIPDKMEGKLVISGSAYFPIASPDIPHVSDLRKLGIHVGGTMKGLHVSSQRVTYHTPDMFVLSLCGSRTNESLLKEGNDAVIRIAALQIFAEELALKHRDRLGQFEIKRVSYAARDVDFRQKTLEASPFVKEFRFKAQEEVRIVWQALDSKEPFFITDCPEVKPHLRLISRGT